jgi:hypothetical protein
MEQSKSLSPKQIKAVHALLTEATILGAAEKAGVGYSTLRQWMKKDPTFQAALAEACQHMRQQLWQDASSYYHLSPPNRA